MPELKGEVQNEYSWKPLHHWGMSSLDWQVGEGTWLNTTDRNRSTCEATSIANCLAVKASGAVKRCGIYRA